VRIRSPRFGLRLALVGGLVALVAVAVPLAGARVHRSACGATVKVTDKMKFVINRYVQDEMRFDPGTVSLKSGCMMTFEFATPGQSDAHSLSIVKASDLPKTAAQMENCKICGQIGARHVAHPGQPPGPKNPIVHWIVNVGKPGLDGPGDSVGILEAKGAPPGHKSVTVPVSAAPGTTLYFMCGLHPWMQGKIVVK
jgi:plastocyanin